MLLSSRVGAKPLTTPAGLERAVAGSRSRALVEDVEGASRGCSQLLDYMRIDHRCFDIRVSEVFLDLRYNAHRCDIAPLVGDIRLVVQELIYLAAVK